MSERGVVGGVERGINRVLLVGRLVCEPELRELPGGGPVCFLRVACAVGRRPGGSRGRPAALDVLVLGSEARRCGRFLCLGRSVGIRGRLESARWEAGAGREREGSCVVAERVQFLGAPPRGVGRVAAVAVGFSEEMWDVGEGREVSLGCKLPRVPPRPQAQEARTESDRRLRGPGTR